MFLKIAGVCALALATNVVCAEGAPKGMMQLSVGGLSYHLPHDGRFNEFNYGLGIEYQWTESIAFEVGAYKNSVNRTSRYLLTQYHPFELAGFRLGATAGVIDGYPAANKGDATFIILPSFSRQWKHVGINGIFLPPIGKHEGVFFIGFKFPINAF